MSTTFQHLDEHARLLLYAAGELPPAEQLELRQRLEIDEALRRRVAAAEKDLALLTDAFASSDDFDDLDVHTVARAAMRAGETMEAWQAARANVRRPAATARPRSAFWMRVAAVAAIVVVTVLTGRILREMARPQNRQIVQTFETPGLLDMAEAFHAEQVATLAGDLDATSGHPPHPIQNVEQHGREERSAAIIEAVAVAAPLTEDPVLSFDVPLDPE